MDYIKIITALYGLITVIIVMYLLIKLYSVRIHFFDYISGFFKFLSNIFFTTKKATTEGPFKMIFLTLCAVILFGITFLIRYNLFENLYLFYGLVFSLLFLFISSYLLFDTEIDGYNKGVGISSGEYPKRKKEGSEWESINLFAKFKWLFSAIFSLIVDNGIRLAIFIGVFIALMYLFFTSNLLIKSFSNSVNILIGLGMLMLFYIATKNSVIVRILLDKDGIGAFFYHLIFAIPCLIMDLGDYIKEDFKRTPIHLFFILLGLSIISIGYLVIPIIVKLYYTKNNSNNNDKNNLQAQRNELNRQKDEYLVIINRLKSEVNVNWDFVINNNLHTKNDSTKEKLKEYLLNLNFSDDEEKNRNNPKAKIGIKIITLTAAIEIVQTNVPTILANEFNIDNLNQKIKDIDASLKMLKKNNNDKAVILQKMPVYLKSKRVLASANKLNKINNLQHPYNYALSFWVFIHPQPPSYNLAVNKFTTILDHSNVPRILYRMKDNTLKIITLNMDNCDKQYGVCSNKEPEEVKEIYKTNKLLLQKWNHIVLNYSSGTLDVFINKKLVASKINVAPSYLDTIPNITVGEDNGISGGICNVIYYQDELSLSKIELIYDALKDKSPPVI
ncbi:MAG: hypothetical protein CML42_09700 [Rhodobacteraceae bacterium]|nr:hypothetical protein [Paracoccaceae bacterium]|tara:strand:- start:11132 stop:12976 length:1845 start_codon:yes stop_codon:yes gene_type:complete